VSPSGLLEPLDLADLDELRMASAFFTGAWLDPRTSIVFDRVTRAGDALVVSARVGPEEWRQPFRIVCAAGSFHPTRLETLSGDGAVLEVGGFASGVFCDVPRHLTWRRGWLVDTVEIAHVEPAADPSAHLLHDLRGDCAARIDPAASPRARVTRSPRGRLPLARACIDGRDLGWFLLDTGAGASAIETAVADDLGLPGLGRTWVVTPTGGEGAGYRRCRALAIGPLTLPQALLVELDLASISTALGVRLAGIFGFDLFAQAVVRLEHRQPLVVELFSPDWDRPGRRWHDIRFEHRVPVLAARLPPGDDAGSTGLMSLDTGSSAPLVLHERVARRLELMPRTTRQGVRGVSGAGSAGVRTLPWIDVGERFERVRTWSPRPRRGHWPRGRRSAAWAGACSRSESSSSTGPGVASPFSALGNKPSCRVSSGRPRVESQEAPEGVGVSEGLIQILEKLGEPPTETENPSSHSSASPGSDQPDIEEELS
jgi:aspartyl protease